MAFLIIAFNPAELPADQDAYEEWDVILGRKGVTDGFVSSTNPQEDPTVPVEICVYHLAALPELEATIETMRLVVPSLTYEIVSQ